MSRIVIDPCAERFELDGQTWQVLSLFDLARVAERLLGGAPISECLNGIVKIDGKWCRRVW